MSEDEEARAYFEVSSESLQREKGNIDEELNKKAANLKSILQKGKGDGEKQK